VSTPLLYIGNKNYSSWSMRPWLALKWAGIAFEERVVPLGTVGYGKSAIPEIVAVSPSGRVPVLHVGEVRVWDSLAIAEWAAESRPEAGLWPEDPLVRAACRSVVAEMHSGFMALRRDFPMNIRRRTIRMGYGDDAARDLARLDELWRWCREHHGAQGPYLFGKLTLADAFFAPVATRLRTYGRNLSAVSDAYRDAILSEPSFLEWERAALLEPWVITATDQI
jgi:glutathione S-transferase